MSKRFEHEARPLRRGDIELRKSGLQEARAGDFAVLAGDRGKAIEHYKNALRLLVEAFLEDREGQADLFVVCHRIGKELEDIGGCTWEFDSEKQTFTHMCPIRALHSRVGASIAMLTESECLICGAETFECDHGPGDVVDGREYGRRVTNVIAVDHVALTQNPDFAFTFLTSPVYSLKQVERTLGKEMLPGHKLFSHHCQECYGLLEAHPDDIDRSLWEPLEPDS